MPASTVTITGPVVFGDGSAITKGRLLFELTSFDMETGESFYVSGPFEVDVSKDGSFSIDLFETEQGENNTAYKVYISYLDNNTKKYKTEHFGHLSLVGPGPYKFSDLDFAPDWIPTNQSLMSHLQALATSAETNKDITTADREAIETMRQEVADDLVETDQDQQATAADREQTGLDRIATGEDRTQTNIDRTLVSQHKTTVVNSAAQVAQDRVQTGLDRTAASDSATQAALYNGSWVDDVGSIFTDTTLNYGTGAFGVAVGDTIRIRKEGFTYEVAASGATDHHLATAGGVKLYENRTGAGGRFEYAYLSNPINGTGSNLLIRNPAAGATRVHLEPNGHISTGTVTKFDWMLDPFDDDQSNYRIFNVYTATGDLNGTGESGIAFIGAKNTGNFWGNWTSLHFGFSDDSASSVPMKMYLLDHSAPQHYTPHKGAWREGKTVSIGDYVNTLNAGVGRLYVAASAGVCGSTLPTHTSGTVSDGGVDWTFVRQVSSSNVEPVVVFGERDDMPILGDSTSRVQFHKNTLTKYAIKQKFQAADETEAGYFQVGATNSGADDWFYISLRSGDYVRYHLDDQYVQNVGIARALVSVTATASDTTPDVTGIEMLRFTNGAATTVTALSGGAPGQRITLISTNSNTTIKHTASTSGGLIRNHTGADIVLSVDGALDLVRDGAADFWRVVGAGY